MIRKGMVSDASALTQVSFAAKRHWNYAEEFFDIWHDELTLTEDYISSNEVFVYETASRVVAYYSITVLMEDVDFSGAVLEKGVWLDHMFVVPEQMGKKIGTAMMDHLGQWCRKNEVMRVRILADPNVRGFYEKKGCRYVGEVPSSIKGRTTPLMIMDVC